MRGAYAVQFRAFDVQLQHIYASTRVAELFHDGCQRFDGDLVLKPTNVAIVTADSKGLIRSHIVLRNELGAHRFSEGLAGLPFMAWQHAHRRRVEDVVFATRVHSHRNIPVNLGVAAKCVCQTSRPLPCECTAVAYPF